MNNEETVSFSFHSVDFSYQYHPTIVPILYLRLGVRLGPRQADRGPASQQLGLSGGISNRM